MAFAGDEDDEIIAKSEATASAAQSAAQLRDQLWDNPNVPTVKVVAALVVGWVVFRFLFKR